MTKSPTTSRLSKQAQFTLGSHGSDVIDPVWQLLEQAYRQFGNLPTLLERDFNIPSLEVLSRELDIMRTHQAQSTIPVAAAQ